MGRIATREDDLNDEALVSYRVTVLKALGRSLYRFQFRADPETLLPLPPR